MEKGLFDDVICSNDAYAVYHRLISVCTTTSSFSTPAAPAAAPLPPLDLTDCRPFITCGRSTERGPTTRRRLGMQCKEVS
eukprot:767777-Hanusia_phi.AAC.4